MIDDALVPQLADAGEQVRPVEPLTARAPGLDLAGAHAVQRGLVRRWTDAGDQVVGHEVGLTSAALSIVSAGRMPGAARLHPHRLARRLRGARTPALFMAA